MTILRQDLFLEKFGPRVFPSHASSRNEEVSRASSSGVAAAALRRGLDILELFLEPNDWLKVPEMTDRLGIPRASVHELVSALVERGYLPARTDVPGRFVPGVRAFPLGGAYERELDLPEVGRESARPIAAKCGETVQLVVREGQLVVYLVKVDSTHSIRLVSEVGRRLPAHRTAVGKALLATLSDDEIDELFPDDASLGPMTADSISTKERLFKDLALARQRGWAEEHGESNENAACVTARSEDLINFESAIHSPIRRFLPARYPKTAAISPTARKRNPAAVKDPVAWCSWPTIRVPVEPRP